MSKWPGCTVVSCKNDACHLECQLLKQKQEEEDTQTILTHWRQRFPNNAYSWPGVPESFALEAARALRVADRASQQISKTEG